MNNFIKRVSECITMDDIKSWETGSVITINATTGAGKSWWVKNILYKLAKDEDKKILFLIHRKNCVEQFRNELKDDGKADTIFVDTYQKLESILQKTELGNLDQYAYIVCDEFHYWLSDASFSITTDISFKFLMEQSATKILLSATADYLKSYMDDYLDIQTISYEIERTFNVIDKLIFYKNDGFMDELIKECIDNGEKAILFIQSATKAYDLYTRHKDSCLFNCSSNNRLYTHVDKDKINKMLKDKRFEENILITTTCMDAGVNIEDEQVKVILANVEDADTIVQCLGRKRAIHSDDKITAYISSISNKSLGGKKTQLNEKLKRANFLMEHTTQEYIKEFKRTVDISMLIYDDVVLDNDSVCTKKINIMMYLKIMADLHRVDTMIDMGKEGFNMYMTNKLNIGEYEVVENEETKSTLELYLDSIVGKLLDKENQKELIEKVGLKDSRGRLQKSISLINTYIIENTNYTVNVKNKKKTIDGKRKLLTYWIVGKIEKKS